MYRNRQIKGGLFAAALILFTLLPAAFAAAGPLSISAQIGGNFLNYQKGYLSTGAALVYKIRPDMELDLGADFALSTSGTGEDIVADILIPLDLGLNFTFPTGSMEYLLGIGLSPTFNNRNSDDSFRFYMGPFLKGGIRLQIHPVMSWFVEAQQDLLIGPPLWINTSTRIHTGILFEMGPVTKS